MAGLLLACLTYFPLFKAHHPLRQPGARGGDRRGAGRRHRRPGRVLVPVQPGRHLDLHHLLRHRQDGAGQARHPLRERRGAGRHRRHGRGRRHGDPSVAAPGRAGRSTSATPGRRAARRPRRPRRGVRRRARRGARRRRATRPRPIPRAINTPMVVLLLWRPGALRHHGLRARSRRCWSRCSRPGSATPRCRCPTTSATAGSAASCPPPSFAIVAATGNIYSGLWYPIVIAAATLRHRHALRPRDQGRRHLRPRLTAAAARPRARADPSARALSLPGAARMAPTTTAPLPSPARPSILPRDTGLRGPDMPQQVLIADDHPLMRAALAPGRRPGLPRRRRARGGRATTSSAPALDDGRRPSWCSSTCTCPGCRASSA